MQVPRPWAAAGSLHLENAAADPAKCIELGERFEFMGRRDLPGRQQSIHQMVPPTWKTSSSGLKEKAAERSREECQEPPPF